MKNSANVTDLLLMKLQADLSEEWQSDSRQKQTNITYSPAKHPKLNKQHCHPAKHPQLNKQQCHPAKHHQLNEDHCL